MNGLLETQKKMAELFIAITKSDIEQNYEMELLRGNCKLSFIYTHELDDCNYIERVIGLHGNNETYCVFAEGDDLLFASKDIEKVVEFIEKQVDELYEDDEPNEAKSLLHFENGKWMMNGIPFTFKRISESIAFKESE